jgi:hypothetical protein
MTKQIKAMPGEHPVERAIAEGKIPESRRAHYLTQMAKRPKATAKLLDRLEPVLEPPEVMEGVAQYIREGGGQTQTALSGSRAQTGPSEYPAGWLRPGEIGAQGGRITFEDPAAAFGGVSPELA